MGLRLSVVVRIKQYVYFAMTSDNVSPDAMAREIGLAADSVMVRGSERAGPRPRPALNSWKIVCETAGLTVDDQVELVLDRIRPYQPAIRECVRTHGVTAMLQVVRYLGAWLDDDDGEEEEITVTEDGLEKLPGQHQLLGWGLDADVLAFLLDVGAEIDVDEYG